jgi:hypothetical protein
MYEKITGEDPYQVPMRIYPAPHYTMGGLWVDYNLMTTVPGLFAIGEANFSDHGANRLGASALMQGLADGYFIIPLTVGNFLAQNSRGGVDENHPAAVDAVREVTQKQDRLLGVKGSRSVDSFHMELGRLMWNHCGMARNEAGLREALGKIPELRERFWKDVRVPGSAATLNQSLEKAGRVADFLEFAEIMCHDALTRDESCGAHFREEHITEEGRPSGTTRPSPTGPSGSSRAWVKRPSGTGSPSPSNTCPSPRGATSNESHTARLASGRPPGPGALRDLSRPGHLRGHVVPGHARPGERGHHRGRVGSPSPSSTTAGRGSAARAG